MPTLPLRADAPLLPPAARSLLARGRRLLQALEPALRDAAADEDMLRRLAETSRDAEEGLLVVVVGEFNAGKSSVLNTLFGEGVLEEGPVPTTDAVTLVRYGERPETHRRGDGLVERTVPAPLLQGLTLVDTPGTNSIILAHQALTEDIVPRADLVLFVTSFDRPLSESERAFLDYVRGGWGRPLAVVLNKADLAASEADLEQVLSHVRSGFERLLGLSPRTFPVSARGAMAAKRAAAAGTPDPERWEASGFPALEAFLTETLAGPERVALKLAAPLATADRALETLAQRVAQRRSVVAADAGALAAFEADLASEADALREDTARQLTEIDAALLELERRGLRFLDDTIRISGLRLLRDRDRFKEEFARQVLRDAEREIEAAMGTSVDALLRRVLALWNRAYAFAAEQARRVPAGGASAPQAFLYDRERVFGEVSRAARRYVERYDLREEARRLLETARSAAALFAGAQAAAVGVGALVGVLVAATAFDVTGGLLAAGALSVAGFWLLPRERRRAQKAFSERVDALRSELKSGLREAFDTEAEQELAGVRALVRPVAEFVGAEESALDALDGQHAALSAEAAALRAEAEGAFGKATL